MALGLWPRARPGDSMASTLQHKDILYISYFYNDRTLRARWLLPLLLDHGYRATVVCAPPESMGPAVQRLALREDGPFVREVADPLLPQARRLKKALERPGAWFRRKREAETPAPLAGSRTGFSNTLIDELLAWPDRQGAWIPGAVRAARAAARQRRFRLVYATSGPASDLFVGWLVARALELPLVTEFRDLWVDNQFVQYRLAPRRSLDRAWEGRILRRSSRIVVVTAPQAKLLTAAHPDVPPDRIRLIPNGYAPSIQTSPAGFSGGAGAPLLLTYTGELYGGASPDALLRVVADLANEQPGMAPVRVRFVGRVDARYETMLRRYQEHGLVERRGPCSLDESLEEMRRADALLLLIGHGPRADGIMTSKIFPYIASGRPILALVPSGGVAAGVIRESGSGLIADPDSTSEVRGALDLIRRGHFVPPPEERVRPVLERHAWPVLARRVAELLREAEGPAG